MLRCVSLCCRSVRLLICAALCLLATAPAWAGVSVGSYRCSIFNPTATIPITAHAMGTGNCDWIKITVDGVEYNATMTNGQSGYSGTINWDASQAGNPSEHTLFATAQFSYYGYIFTYSSTDSVSQGGDGEIMDFVIADLHLKSFEYVNAYTLRNQASAASPPSPDPAIVPSPQFVWDLSGTATTGGASAGDIQGKTPAFKIKLYPLTGDATIGFKIKWTATPNTGDPDLTLYDNTTTGSQPTPFTGGAFAGAAQRALLSKVAKYSNAYTLSLYIKFTHIANPDWYPISTTYLLGNTLYATLAQPTAPMSEPWVNVLNYACDWAKGTSAATAATTAVCNGFYTNAKYSPTQVWYTDTSVPEKFSLLGFLNKTLGASTAPSGLQGQCNDFADFLTCLSTALGAVPLQSQKSNGGFNYGNVFFAPDTSGTHSGYFAYHQWAASGNVFDSAVRPSQSTVSPPVNEALSTYLDWLAPNYGLTAGSTFTPDVVN